MQAEALLQRFTARPSPWFGRPSFCPSDDNSAAYTSVPQGRGICMVAKRSRGFTLLEVIVVILAAIVLPAYQSQVRKGNRSAAEQFMQDVATLEQQIILDSRLYDAV